MRHLELGSNFMVSVRNGCSWEETPDCTGNVGAGKAN